MDIKLIRCPSCVNFLTSAEEHCINGLCWECCEKKHLSDKIECTEEKCFLYKREVCKGKIELTKGGLEDKPYIEEGV
ncbi:MAG: hypothetical protein ABUK08_00275 [Candidatus Humimicrobiaceae bacterium]